MARYTGSDDFRGTEFVALDMSRAQFRDVDLSDTRMRGVLLLNADIDGAIDGLRVNGVDVAPLVEAELDRRYPERTKLRPVDADGMRQAWAVIESFWAATMDRARSLTNAELHQSVDGEWSFAETLRHLVFVIDGWFARAVLGERRPYHPIGLPPTFIINGAELGIDPTASPSFDEVVAVRAERVASVRSYLATVTQADLDRVRDPNPASGWPPPEVRTATDCLHVLFDEEWAHHRFATRDLAATEAAR